MGPSTAALCRGQAPADRVRVCRCVCWRVHVCIRVGRCVSRCVCRPRAVHQPATRAPARAKRTRPGARIGACTTCRDTEHCPRTSSTSTPCRGLLRPRPRPGRPGPAGGVRHLGPSRVEPGRRVQRGAHRGDHGRDRASTGAAGHRRPAVPRPRHPRAVASRRGGPRWRCSLPPASTCASTPATATPRRRRSRTRSCSTTAPRPSRACGRRRPRAAGTGLADGIVVTPSHNPPRDGGFKYNPPHGGPADSDATSWIADRANELLAIRGR